MLQLSGSLLRQPVLSLRTGRIVATTQSPIINPNNLKIEGFYCTDAEDRKKTVILLYQDIRDIIAQGFVVNDYDVLAEPSELVRLKDILAIQFNLMGKAVVTVSKEKVGKITEYAVELETMYVQKLYLSPSLLKNITGGSLVVDRSHIVEITDRKIVIQDLLPGVPASAGVPA